MNIKWKKLEFKVMVIFRAKKIWNSGRDFFPYICYIIFSFKKYLFIYIFEMQSYKRQRLRERGLEQLVCSSNGQNEGRSQEVHLDFPEAVLSQSCWQGAASEVGQPGLGLRLMDCQGCRRLLTPLCFSTGSQWSVSFWDWNPKAFKKNRDLLQCY